jgi:hypothetical protein
MKRWYVGQKNGTRWTFKSEYIPTEVLGGNGAEAVIGPFKTIRAARWACSQFNNPHFQTVADAERISRMEGK